MGYWGRMLVARSARPLSELSAVREVDVLDEKIFQDGWRCAQLDGDVRKALPALVTGTGAPALTAYILDSDAAVVEALTPGGVSWQAYLHEATALEYQAPPLEHPVDEVVRRALAWSAEAGVTASGAALGAAFGAHNDTAEETLDELLAALGLVPVGVVQSAAD
ncbi:hypothetical protein ACI2K4_18570 [Micromonospora sp. NPDC050397]|uniref:hypothetical protein n=1 Tax=Micromonospora sp. NPDC050397 TaxID=3364279 RepID=UPI00384F2010